MKPLWNWYKKLSRKAKVGVVSGALLVPVIAVGGSGSTTSQSAPTPRPVVVHKDVQQVEPVAFQTETKQDNTLAQGTQKVLREGVDGSRTTTWDVTYQDGKEVSRIAKGNPVVKAAVNKVVAHGTYIAPTVNSVAPTTGSSGGATAKCNDGSLSYSVHRQGTCSHHGGVAIWY